MGAREKLRHELKALAVATAYFGAWIGALLVLKSLLLAEYHVKASGYAKALVGVVVLAKVVLVLEHVPLRRWERTSPAWVIVLLRTGLYSAGVAAVLTLERGLEGARAHGGFARAVEAAWRSAGRHHVLVTTLCVAGALLGYNLLEVARRALGEGALVRMLRSPLAPRGGADGG